MGRSTMYAFIAYIQGLAAGIGTLMEMRVGGGNLYRAALMGRAVRRRNAGSVRPAVAGCERIAWRREGEGRSGLARSKEIRVGRIRLTVARCFLVEPARTLLNLLSRAR